MSPAGGPALLCDLDGTLVDSFADITNGIEVALGFLGAPFTDELRGLCRRGVPLEAFYARIRNADADERDTDGEFSGFVDAYRRAYVNNQQHTVAYPGVKETLLELRARLPRVRIAVATTKRTDMAVAVLEKTGLLPLFDHVQGSDGLRKKPAPDILIAAASAIGAETRGTVMVGDTDNDVLAAKAAGARPVAVGYGGFTAAELSALGPECVLDSFSEVLSLTL